MRTEKDQSIYLQGDICTIRFDRNYVVITSSAPAPAPDELPTCFLDVLVEWECTWMWESLRLVGEDN